LAQAVAVAEMLAVVVEVFLIQVLNRVEQLLLAILEMVVMEQVETLLVLAGLAYQVEVVDQTFLQEAIKLLVQVG
jgi:hypothetical protein